MCNFVPLLLSLISIDVFDILSLILPYEVKKAIYSVGFEPSTMTGACIVIIFIEKIVLGCLLLFAKYESMPQFFGS